MQLAKLVEKAVPFVQIDLSLVDGDLHIGHQARQFAYQLGAALRRLGRHDALQQAAGTIDGARPGGAVGATVVMHQHHVATPAAQHEFHYPGRRQRPFGFGDSGA